MKIGRIITEQRGIFTSPSKKGHYASTVGHLLGPFPKYAPDPYDSKRIAENVNFSRLFIIIIHHAKLESENGGKGKGTARALEKCQL